MILTIKPSGNGYSIKLDDKEISSFTTDIKTSIKPDKRDVQLNFTIKNMQIDDEKVLFQLLGNERSDY